MDRGGPEAAPTRVVVREGGPQDRATLRSFVAERVGPCPLIGRAPRSVACLCAQTRLSPTDALSGELLQIGDHPIELRHQSREAGVRFPVPECPDERSVVPEGPFLAAA